MSGQDDEIEAVPAEDADARDASPDEAGAEAREARDMEQAEADAEEAAERREGGTAGGAGDDLEALQARAAEAALLAEKLKRVEAAFVNEAKRIRRQAEEDRKYAIESVLVDMLPVLDALQGARGALGEGAAAQAMREGLGLVERQLDALFQRHGVAAIEPLGKPFDPARHQAMLVVERADHEPSTVCEVLRPGYELHGRVVRPAEVAVTRAPAPAPEDPPAETEDD
jgi:molecular chaperone GrpE